MPDNAMGDEVYQPSASDPQDNPDDLDMEDALGEPDLDQILDEGYSPPERPLAVNRGTTAREQFDGESLEQRLSEEVPEVWPPDGDGIGDQVDGDGEPVDDQVGGERAGRLMTADEGFPRHRNDVVAHDVGIDGGAASAEEAAVHLCPESGEEAPAG
ncbi:DUF5709 domain-containing protein [Streptomyces sp. NPDC059080]|uniref:DUF5709 domain-containing protein n=1 Tax=Streptomyces sp. NPDC059080 TaxID=3346718 RepID=UPI0036B5570B